MTFELAYVSPGIDRQKFSSFGYTATGLSASLLLLPAVAWLVNDLGALLLRSPASGMTVVAILRLLITAQMLLIVGIPASGLALGIAGIAVSRRRCVLAGLSTGFNAAMLLGLCLTPH